MLGRGEAAATKPALAQADPPAAAPRPYLSRVHSPGSHTEGQTRPASRGALWEVLLCV